jgi:drug/metabolite transporter (DMT)-like permease
MLLYFWVHYNVPVDGSIGSAALGLTSAASWGAGDFCGGLATRRGSVYGVVIGAHASGAVLFLALALALREAAPAFANLAACAAAGLFGSLGLLALYRALAMGRMGIAAPVSGVLSAAVPVVAGALLEGRPGGFRLIGFALALVAVWLVSRTDDGAFCVRDIGLPVAAGLGFGLFIVIIGRASAGGVFWPLVAARVASLGALTLVAGLSRQPLLPARHDLPLVALAGLFDAGGNAFVVLAAHAGRLDVAAVLSSLYPATTVVLAWVFLHERISRWQLAGLVLALAAIVIITLP